MSQGSSWTRSFNCRQEEGQSRERARPATVQSPRASSVSASQLPANPVTPVTRICISALCEYGAWVSLRHARTLAGQRRILALVILQVLAGADALDPGGVLAIPA